MSGPHAHIRSNLGLLVGANEEAILVPLLGLNANIILEPRRDELVVDNTLVPETCSWPAAKGRRVIANILLVEKKRHDAI